MVQGRIMKKQVVVITGASSGIGAGIAQLFSESGYHLGLLAQNMEKMEQYKFLNSLCIVTDVTDINSVKQAMQTIDNKLGTIDCLINCAGFGMGGEFTQVSHDDNEKMLQVNLFGTVNCIEAVLPGMQKRKSGTIINISSLADRQTSSNGAIYGASKAAIRSLSESLRAENAMYGVRICNVAPAKIKTPMLVAFFNNRKQKDLISA